MRILVLGGAGYIGSHTALELVRAGHEVIVADNLLTGHRNAVPKQVKFYEGDIRDAAFWISCSMRKNRCCDSLCSIFDGGIQ